MSAPSDWMIEQGQAILAEARQEYTSASFAHAAGDPSGESHLREALKKYWSAMNWLEGSDGFDVAHDELHRAGRDARDWYPAGCEYAESDDGSFVQRCPVPLAHKRFGMSIGAFGNAICSLCGTDASECPHLPGRTYEVPAEKRDGQCNICRKSVCKEHLEGLIYPAQLGVIVTEMDVQEVSIVPVPAMPDARITGVPVTRERMEERFGHRLPDGVVVTCDQCLGECQGFRYLGQDNEPGLRWDPRSGPVVVRL